MNFIKIITISNQLIITIKMVIFQFFQLGCTKDVDCKGDRICVNDRCSDPGTIHCSSILCN